MSRGTILLGIFMPPWSGTGSYPIPSSLITAEASRLRLLAMSLITSVHLAAQEGTSSGHVLYVLSVADTYSLGKQNPNYFSPSQPLVFELRQILSEHFPVVKIYYAFSSRVFDTYRPIKIPQSL